MKDVLDFFDDLPDFPGGRAPKNRPTKARVIVDPDDPFNGVQAKIIMVHGAKRQFYTVGNAAKVLGRTAQTLRQWERKGWIPSPTYRTANASGSGLLNPKSKGYRLYSREQVEIMLAGLQENNLLGDRTPAWQHSDNWVGFIEYIKNNWKK